MKRNDARRLVESGIADATTKPFRRPRLYYQFTTWIIQYVTYRTTTDYDHYCCSLVEKSDVFSTLLNMHEKCFHTEMTFPNTTRKKSILLHNLALVRFRSWQRVCFEVYDVVGIISVGLRIFRNYSEFSSKWLWGAMQWEIFLANFLTSKLCMWDRRWTVRHPVSQVFGISKQPLVNNEAAFLVVGCA